MSALIPTVPSVATSVNYPAGSEPWSGAATRLAALTSGFVTYGWTPDFPPGAQEFNKWAYDLTESARDLQVRAIPKIKGQGWFDQSGAFFGYLPLMGLWAFSRLGAYIRYGSRNFPTYPNLSGEIAPAGGVDLHSTKVANYRNGTTSKLAWMPYGALGTTAALDVITDTNPPAHSYGTLPHALAIYTHSCMDVSTGNFVAVSGAAVAGADAGFAYGNPSALAFSPPATTVGWAADTRMSVASKPGEVRAFGKAHTFASTDGGATVSALQTTVWDGGTPLGNMFPPCWDPKFNRWICAVGHHSTSATITLANSGIWISEDGIIWELIGPPPAFTSITHIVEHSGILFAIARLVAIGSVAGHQGLEILFSLDGGTTWKRPGIDLSLESAGYSANAEAYYHHLCGFVKMGSTLLAQTALQVADLTGGAIAAGNGVEYVALQVHGDDADV